MVKRERKRKRPDCAERSWDKGACDAYDIPENYEEYIKAYFHWRFHSHMGGCAHGF